ncbi:MAG: hypothetical protein LBL74_05960 [Bacteroidales bacterium]|jgi:SAM-dependent methyltransferase|nr:hypothetical protein [Bacteroidales bacterium]
MEQEPKQIKSKHRVINYGEVFTAQREVDAMLDLVKSKAKSIESRILEPACGNGNFLVEILHRRLQTIRKRDDIKDRRFKILVALSAIYGVDIQQDNVTEARNRMTDVVRKEAKDVSDEPFLNNVSKILEHNIIKGDFINGKDKIYFIEYTPDYHKRTFSICLHNLADLETEEIDADTLFLNLDAAISRRKRRDKRRINAIIKEEDEIKIQRPLVREPELFNE